MGVLKSIADFFNRGKAHEEREMNKELDFPFEYLVVPGSKAVETCLQIREDKSKNVVPVMLGGREGVDLLLDCYEYNEMTPAMIINRAEDFKIEEFIHVRVDEDPEFYEEMQGEWPDDPRPSMGLTVHTEVLAENL